MTASSLPRPPQERLFLVAECCSLLLTTLRAADVRRWWPRLWGPSINRVWQVDMATRLGSPGALVLPPLLSSALWALQTFSPYSSSFDALQGCLSTCSSSLVRGTDWALREGASIADVAVILSNTHTHLSETLALLPPLSFTAGCQHSVATLIMVKRVSRGVKVVTWK